MNKMYSSLNHEMYICPTNTPKERELFGGSCIYSNGKKLFTEYLRTYLLYYECGIIITSQIYCSIYTPGFSSPIYYNSRKSDLFSVIPNGSISNALISMHLFKTPLRWQRSCVFLVLDHRIVVTFHMHTSAKLRQCYQNSNKFYSYVSDR